jgi:hypothetical protein
MGNYATVDDVRLEGVPASYSDQLINLRIVKWEKLIEKMTRQVFYEVEPGELTFDGNNSAILHFNLPLIEVTSLKINGESIELPTDEYRAYTGRTPPQDDRGNPRIKLTPIRATIFRTHPGMFVKGLDQKITAKWGYLESDDTTPKPITDSVVKLVVLDLNKHFESAGAPTGVTALKRERTDGHEVEYMDLEEQKLYWDMMPNDIASVLALYRAPLAIGAPEPIRWDYDPGIETEIIGF